MTNVDEAIATMARAGRRIDALRRRNEALSNALAGLIGLVEMVSHRDDVSPALREVLAGNHRIITANATLAVDKGNPL